MRQIKFVLIILFSALTFAIQAQESLLSGTLQNNNELVDFAYIVNKSRNSAVESTDGGKIKIAVAVNDTLQFRCLGYKDTCFIVSKEMLATKNNVLNVEKQDYALDEVKVVWFYSYASFKQAFLNLKLDDTYKPRKFNVAIDPMDIAIDNYFYKPGATGFGVSLGGNRPYLTKEQREEKTIKSVAMKYERYNNLTSYENLQAFTGLKGNSLDTFVLYLRSKVKINPDASDYDIMYSVKLAYEEFLAMNVPAVDSLGF